MEHFRPFSAARRAALRFAGLSAGAAFTAAAQSHQSGLQDVIPPPPHLANARLPNGKSQSEEILKQEFAKNLSDSRELTELARTLQEDLEKEDRFVLSLATLKKLDDIEKIAKRIRSRLKH